MDKTKEHIESNEEKHDKILGMLEEIISNQNEILSILKEHVKK